MKETTFIGLTKGEIETVFDNLNGYGLDLLSDVIEAWQYNHEDDSSILKKAYLEIREIKEQDEIDEYITPFSKIRGVRKGLSNLTDRQLKFIEDILEIDPYMDNPYTNYKEYEGQEDYESETIGINPYDEMRKYVADERNFRFEASNNINNLFLQRYYRSILNDKVIVDTNELFSERFNRSMYSDTNKLFSNRFNKSLKMKLDYKPGDLFPYTE